MYDVKKVHYFNGLIYSPRLTVGKAVYTSNFIPYTGTLTASINTQLLMPINSNNPIKDLIGTWFIIF
jgi:hypothetical protein